MSYKAQFQANVTSFFVGWYIIIQKFQESFALPLGIDHGNSRSFVLILNYWSFVFLFWEQFLSSNWTMHKIKCGFCLFWQELNWLNNTGLHSYCLQIDQFEINVFIKYGLHLFLGRKHLRVLEAVSSLELYHLLQWHISSAPRK